MWTWVGVFATASFTAAGLGPAASQAGSLAAFLAIGSGAAGCALAGYVCRPPGQGARRRLGAGDQRGVRGAHRRRSSAHAPVWLFALVMVWGFAVVADSAQFSALVSEYAPRRPHRHGADAPDLVGFLLTMVTIDALPRVAARGLAVRVAARVGSAPGPGDAARCASLAPMHGRRLTCTGISGIFPLYSIFRARRPHRHLRRRLRGDVDERLRRGGVRLGDHQRNAAIAADANRLVERQPAEERHVHLLRPSARRRRGRRCRRS